MKLALKRASRLPSKVVHSTVTLLLHEQPKNCQEKNKII